MFDNATWLETLGVFLALAVFWIVGLLVTGKIFNGRRRK